MTRQVSDYLRFPSREHADFIGDICVAFPEIPHIVAHRRYSLYVTSSMSEDLPDLRRIVCMRRSGRKNWEFPPHLADLSPYCTLFSGEWIPGILIAVVVDGAALSFLRFRWGRAQVRWRMVPDFPLGTLSLRHSCGLVDLSSDSGRDSEVDRPSANHQTPRLSGVELDAPSPQRAHMDSQEARAAGGNEFRERPPFAIWDCVGAFTVRADRLLI